MDKELTVRDITLSYIRENYDVNKERKNIEKMTYIKEVNINQYNKKPKEDYLTWLESQMKDATHVEVDIGYNGGGCNLYVCEIVKEGDHQVYNRLQKEKN